MFRICIERTFPNKNRERHRDLNQRFKADAASFSLNLVSSSTGHHSRANRFNLYSLYHTAEDDDDDDPNYSAKEKSLQAARLFGKVSKLARRNFTFCNRKKYDDNYGKICQYSRESFDGFSSKKFCFSVFNCVESFFFVVVHLNGSQRRRRR